MDPELEKLLGIWLNHDDATEEELNTLRDRLKNDVEFRQAFVGMLDMLGDLKAVQTPQPSWLKLRDITGAPAFDNRATNRPHKNISKTENKRPLSAACYALAGAFVALGLVAIYNCCQQAEPEVPTSAPQELEEDVSPSTTPVGEAVAVVSRSSEAIWTGLPSADSGHLLKTGKIQLESGLVQLDFLGGAHIVIDGPAEIDILSAKKIELISGQISCCVSEFGKGFSILTQHGEIIDQGTAFAVKTYGAERTEVHVTEGSVSIDDQVIEAGNAVSLNGQQTTPVTLTPNIFVKEEEIRRRTELADQKKFTRWKQQATRWSADPDALVHYTMEGQNRTGPALINRAQTGYFGRGSDAMILGTKWAKGRWKHKSAIQFFSPGDRLLAKVPGCYDELTFLIWAQVEALTQGNTAFILTEKPKRWGLNGLIPKDKFRRSAQRRAQAETQTTRWVAKRSSGTHSLNIAFRNGPNLLNWDMYSGDRPVFASGKWGEWACYAVTYSLTSNHVSHFYNGKITSRHPIRRPTGLLLDYLEIGNLSTHQTEKKSGIQYRFYGVMDEILIAKRAISAAEIQAIYDQSKP